MMITTAHTGLNCMVGLLSHQLVAYQNPASKETSTASLVNRCDNADSPILWAEKCGGGHHILEGTHQPSQWRQSDVAVAHCTSQTEIVFTENTY
ncbi:hypothetical protein CEXT_434551 [Caerostris extrusa]|uniref:Uncharacterized protein n=1 Tax=Caerostris extrusa TaxID=172846 RepID=A0AAV4RAX3_CAEEX|nr:hypothetical protein CEXT_434551 [Caerostris extrusa]